MEIKKWSVVYDHKDGRNGKIEVVTEIQKMKDSKYGNGKVGAIMINDKEVKFYDLRYNSGDLHLLMLNDFFGDGFVECSQIVA